MCAWVVFSLSLFRFLSNLLTWFSPHFSRDLHLALPRYPPDQAPVLIPPWCCRNIGHFPGLQVVGL